MSATSEYLNANLRRTETEEEYRARLTANLRAEGASDATIARCTDDKTVRMMMAHEQRVVGIFAGMFFGGRPL